jgi:hypothetical protein
MNLPDKPQYRLIQFIRCVATLNFIKPEPLESMRAGAALWLTREQQAYSRMQSNKGLEFQSLPGLGFGRIQLRQL